MATSKKTVGIGFIATTGAIAVWLFCYQFLGWWHAPFPITAQDLGLPEREAWRTFAKPLAIGRDEMMLFERKGSEAVVWRIDWRRRKAKSFSLQQAELDAEGRYTSLSGKGGIWLLGKQAVLIRPSGWVAFARADLNEPVAVAMDDDSAIVFGSNIFGETTRNNASDRIRQLRVSPESGMIETVDLAPLAHGGKETDRGIVSRMPVYGHAVARLQDGRVLMLGGGSTPRLATVFSFSEKHGKGVQVFPVAPMPHPRIFPAVLTLADGRVAVTGTHYSCEGDQKETRSVDLYDPKSNVWTTLPPLPFVPCSDAYGSDSPSLAETPSGALVVGGGIESNLMLLPRDAASPTGYAASWLVHGQLPKQRISGVVQAISDSDVVVAGGVNSDDNRCCRATPVFDWVAVGNTEARQSRALRFAEAGVARRGNLVFVAAGSAHLRTSRGQLRYSSYAELIDLEKGGVRQLPNVPFVTGRAQAVWLDDDKVVLKGTAIKAPPAYFLESSGAMALFDFKLNRWSPPISFPSTLHSEIVGVEGDEVMLVGSSGVRQRVNLKTGMLQESPPDWRASWNAGRREILSRGTKLKLKLPDERLYGSVSARPEVVSVIDEQCEEKTEANCQERYAGFGPFPPSGDFVFLPLGQVAGTEAGNDGKYAKTTAIGTDLAVYLADPAPQSGEERYWVPLPLPPVEANSSRANSHCSPNGCELVLVPDPRDEQQVLLFLRQATLTNNRDDGEFLRHQVRVWLWDEARRKWIEVINTDILNARVSPIALDSLILGISGKRVMTQGWHLPTPIMWLQ